MSYRDLLWMFPILFIIHDFEEIIFFKSFFKKNKTYLLIKFPQGSNFYHSISTESFAIGVLIQFIMVSMLTFVSILTGQYIFWLGTFIAFAVHLVIHLVQAIFIKRYTPALLTSITTLPISIYMITYFFNTLHINLLSLSKYSILAIILVGLNLLVIHKIIHLAEQYLND